MNNLLPFSLFEANNITAEDWAGNWQESPQWKLLRLMGFEILGTNSKGTVSISSPYSKVVLRLTAGGYVRTSDQGYVYLSSMTSGPKIMSSLLYYVIKRFIKKGIPLIPVKDLDDFMEANPEMIDVLLDLPKVREGVVSRTGIPDPMDELYKRHGLTPSVVNWLDKSTNKEWGLNETTGEIDISGNFSSTTENKLGFRGIKFGVVSGFFFINNAGLTSLEGAPRIVKGNFDCSFNNLKNLEGAPLSVGGIFACSQNQLTTLEGAPESAGSFIIGHLVSAPSIRTLDWGEGWRKKGDAEFIKTLISKLKKINAGSMLLDIKQELKEKLLSLLDGKEISDYILSNSLSTSDKFEIYGEIKANMPDIWNKIKDKLDPEGATSDLLDLGF